MVLWSPTWIYPRNWGRQGSKTIGCIQGSIFLVKLYGIRVGYFFAKMFCRMFSWYSFICMLKNKYKRIQQTFVEQIFKKSMMALLKSPTFLQIPFYAKHTNINYSEMSTSRNRVSNLGSAKRSLFHHTFWNLAHNSELTKANNLISKIL